MWISQLQYLPCAGPELGTEDTGVNVTGVAPSLSLQSSRGGKQ